MLSIVFSSCKDNDTLVTEPERETDQQEIHIGGISLNDELETEVQESGTRAATEVDAEKQTWLIGPLKKGLDITYGLANKKSTQKVAILKLTGGTESDLNYEKDPYSQWAVYSFDYKDPSDGTYAVWNGNGPHFFEGVYVPEEIRYGAGVSDANRTTIESVNNLSAPGILTDQHEDVENHSGTTGPGNYTLLERYLGMPANTRRSATVARIKLPFSHRLARVLAYVLIDPTMGSDVKLQGYKKSLEDIKVDVETEDPTNTSIRFCNVEVLEGVLDEKSAGNDHHTLTPKWKKMRKVTPHFVGERASINSQQTVVDADNFIVYFNTSTETYIFPANDKAWVDAKTAYDNAYNAATGTEQEKAEKATEKSHYRKINYGKVPVYDIILRPTYTSVDNVMYDEEGVKKSDGTEDTTVKQQFYAKQNQIDFDLTLNNGLQYFKNVEIDLDANRQTIIYLRISRESINYNSSGSELWVSQVKEDDWYGVDNTGDHSLSDAGSSWQRAYTTGETVTVDKVTDGGYYNENTSTDVNTKGQYVSQVEWIKNFAQAHECGEHHGDYFVLKQDITIDAKDLPIGFVFTGHLDAQDHVITVTGTSTWVTCNNEVFAKLKHQVDVDYVGLPDLYYLKEEAQSRGQKNAAPQNIDKGEPIKIVMNTTTPADVEGYILFTKNDEGVYELYENRNFYKKTASALFCGLNGVYTTIQEKEEAVGHPIYKQDWEWEANVHKENNVWVPYRDVSSADATKHTGWRAEVINLKVKGSLFETDATISGNVQNCYQGTNNNIKVKDHVPAIPKYN